MILSEREIQAAIRRGSISIRPEPPDTSTPEKGSPWSSTTLDLHLAPELTEWQKSKDGADVTFKPPDDPEFDLDQLIQKYAKVFTIPPEGFRLSPGQFVLGWTAERIRLPSTSRLAARVEGKSSLARLGVGVHVTAPIIHAGFGVKTGDHHLRRQSDPSRNLPPRVVPPHPEAADEDMPVSVRGSPRNAGEGIPRPVRRPRFSATASRVESPAAEGRVDLRILPDWRTSRPVVTLSVMTARNHWPVWRFRNRHHLGGT